MPRKATLFIALNILLSGSLAAQENVGPYAETAPDSVDAARAGQLAAAGRGVSGYFVASFLGGLSTGFLLPIGITFSEPVSFVLGGTGAAIIGLTTHHAARRELPADSIISDHLLTTTREQVRLFRAGYRERLSRRRVRASLWGGATGAGIGAGTLVWLVSQIGDY